MLDEASKPTEPESWNILANYRPRAFIFVGDHQQLKPVVMSRPDRNNFAGQLSISLFARIRLAGYPGIMFNEQHRMHPAIARLVSEVFYSGALRDAASVRTETPVTMTVRGIN